MEKFAFSIEIFWLVKLHGCSFKYNALKKRILEDEHLIGRSEKNR